MEENSEMQAKKRNKEEKVLGEGRKEKLCGLEIES